MSSLSSDPDPSAGPPHGDSIDQLNEGQLVLIGAGTLTAILSLLLGLLLLLGAFADLAVPVPLDKVLGALAFPVVACLLALIAMFCSRSATTRRAARKDAVPTYLLSAAATGMIVLAWLISG